MKQKTFFIVFEGLLFGEKQKFDKKYWAQALNTYFGYSSTFVYFSLYLL